MSAAKKPRVRKISKHSNFKLSKKTVKRVKAIPSAWKIFKRASKIFTENKKLFLGIVLINFVLTLVFVQGLSGSIDLVEVKQNLEELFGANPNHIATAVSLFGVLLSSAGSSASETSSAYQFFTLIITSLATIWAIRQIQAGEKPTIRETFYKGMYPLVAFILIVMLMSLQLLPLLIGNLIYSTVVNNGLAPSLLEKSIWLILFLLLALLSAYLVVASFIALYVVTLPDMRPMMAIRSASELVLHRRIAVGLRIAALPILFLVVSAIILIPILLFITPIASAIFSLLVSTGIVFAHIYMYLLYRSLIDNE